MEINNYAFHLLNSVNYLDFHDVRIIIQELGSFADTEEFYTDDNYLEQSLNFVSRMYNFYIKEGSLDLIIELFILTTKIVDGMKSRSNKNKCAPRFKTEIGIKIIHVIALLLECQTIQILVIGSKLLAAIIDAPFVKYPDVISLYDIAVRVLKFHRQYSALGIIFFAVIKRQGHRGKGSDCYSSYLDLEKHCLDCLQGTLDNEAEEIIMKCLILVYTYKCYNFSSELNIMMPFLNQVCILIAEPSCRKPAAQLLANLMDSKNYFQANCEKLHRDIQKLPHKHEEWPSSKKEIFFMIVYMFFTSRRLLWTSDEILKSICFYVQHNRRISDDGLKSILMLYSSMITDDISDQNILYTGEIIMKYLRCHKNLKVILTRHELPLSWIFKNADDFLIHKVLEDWFQLENDDNEIAYIFRAGKFGNILINYFITCSKEDALMLLKVSKILCRLKSEKCLSREIHQAIVKVCSDINKLEVLLRANFDVPEEPDMISKHLKILHLALPLLNEEASIIAGCNYFSVLMGSFNKFGVNCIFDDSKLKLLTRFLISVSCRSNDSLASATNKLLTSLLEENQLYIPLGLLVPFRKIIVGSSQRINSGVELFYQILVHQENCFLISLNNNGVILLELYKYLFELVSDDTVSAIVKLLKLLSEIQPELYYRLDAILKTRSNVFSEETKRLLNIYCRFARSIYLGLS